MKIAILASISKTQYFINQAYADYVQEAGMTPVVITPNMPVEMALSLCDGLILPGGIDIDPIYYGKDNDSSIGADPMKDAFERAMFHAFRESMKPIFGICRGFQLIVLEYLQAFPEMDEFMEFWQSIYHHQQTNDQQLGRNVYSHYVNFVRNHLFGEGGMKIETMPVNSMHHQCLYADLEKEGITAVENFRLAAWTRRGLKVEKKITTYPVICEAFRIVDWGGPILAVQWHPEELRDVSLLRSFFIGNTEPFERIHLPRRMGAE